MEFPEAPKRTLSQKPRFLHDSGAPAAPSRYDPQGPSPVQQLPVPSPPSPRHCTPAAPGGCLVPGHLHRGPGSCRPTALVPPLLESASESVARSFHGPRRTTSVPDSSQAPDPQLPPAFLPWARPGLRPPSLGAPRRRRPPRSPDCAADLAPALHPTPRLGPNPTAEAAPLAPSALYC